MLALVVAAPAVVLVIARADATWTGVADHAGIELRVRDVLTADSPLVGTFSRYGWNHPGPLGFWALALPERALGSAGLLVGAAAVSALSLVAAVRLAWRAGGLGAAGLLGGLTLAMVLAMGPGLLADPWNPWMAVLPFLAAAVAAWAVLEGVARAVPVAVLAASLAFQSHAGYLPLVGVLGLVVVVGLVVHRRRLRAWAPWLAAAAVVGVLVWLPPLVEQVTQDPGNLTELIDEGRHPSEPPMGWRGVEQILLPHLGVTPAWYEQTWRDLTSGGGRPPGLPTVPLGLVVAAAGVVVAAVRRDAPALRLAGVVAATWVGGAVAAARVSGVPAAYLHRWSFVLALLLWWASLWSLGRWAVDVAGRRGLQVDPRVAGVAGSVVLAVLSTVVAVDAVGAALPPEVTPGDQALAAEAVVALGEVARPGATVEVLPHGPVLFQLTPLMVALERAGYHVQAREESADVVGPQRAVDGSAEAVVVLTDAPAAAAEQYPGLALVGTYDRLSPEDRRRFDELAARGLPCGDVMVAGLFREPLPLEGEELAACDELDALQVDSAVLSVLVGPAPG